MSRTTIHSIILSDTLKDRKSVCVCDAKCWNGTTVKKVATALDACVYIFAECGMMVNNNEQHHEVDDDAVAAFVFSRPTI